MAGHPDHLSSEMRSFLDLVTDHVTNNPDLLDLDANRK